MERTKTNWRDSARQKKNWRHRKFPHTSINNRLQHARHAVIRINLDPLTRQSVAHAHQARIYPSFMAIWIRNWHHSILFPNIFLCRCRRPHRFCGRRKKLSQHFMHNLPPIGRLNIIHRPTRKLNIINYVNRKRLPKRKRYSSMKTKCGTKNDATIYLHQ